jgi:hypothetical protein
MTAEPRLPIYAHWDGQEFRVDRLLTQPEPGVGSIVRIEIEEGCSTQRRPFRVVTRRERLSEASGLDAGTTEPKKVAIDLEVEPVAL